MSKRGAPEKSRRLSSGLALKNSNEQILDDDSDSEPRQQRKESKETPRNKLRASLNKTSSTAAALLGEEQVVAPAKQRGAMSGPQLAKLYEDCMDLANRNVLFLPTCPRPSGFCSRSPPPLLRASPTNFIFIKLKILVVSRYSLDFSVLGSLVASASFSRCFFFEGC